MNFEWDEYYDEGNFDDEDELDDAQEEAVVLLPLVLFVSNYLQIS